MTEVTNAIMKSYDCYIAVYFTSKCFSIIPEVCKERIEILLVFTTVLTSSAFISMLPIIHLGF